MWLWELKDLTVICVGVLLSIVALVQWGFVPPLVGTVLYAFLSIRIEETNILDFIRYAVCFLVLRQQYFEWREPASE